MGLFSDINEVTLMGNATSAPDIKHTNSGAAVASLSLATNRDYKSGDEWKKETTFHNIVIWGNLAERAIERIEKGTRLIVKGRLSTRTWQDAQGQKKYKTEVVASDITLVARYKAREQAPAPQTTGDDIVDPDELPF